MNCSERPDWDSYFMAIAIVVSSRSTCMRRSVGAVLVRDHQILSTGYNGPPRGTPHCEVVGCLREQLGIPSGERLDICRGSHAEMNAVAQAAYVGIPTQSAMIYVTHQPCVQCSKILINAGIQKIVFMNPYPDELGAKLIVEAGVESVHFVGDIPRGLLPC